MRSPSGDFLGNIFDWAKYWPHEPNFKGLNYMISRYYAAFLRAWNKAQRAIKKS